MGNDTENTPEKQDQGNQDSDPSGASLSSPEPAPKRGKGRPATKYTNDPVVGKAIRKLRLSNDMRQEDVIKAADGQISPTSFSKYENGSLFPTEEKMDIILHALDATPQEWEEVYASSDPPAEPASFSRESAPRVRQMAANKDSDTGFISSPELEEIKTLYTKLPRSSQITVLGFIRNLVKAQEK